MTCKTRRIAHETFELAIERRFVRDRRHARHLTCKTPFTPRIDARDTASAFAQSGGHFIERITEARHNAHARHDHARQTTGRRHTRTHGMRLKINDVLMPPNAKLLLITYSASIVRPHSMM